MNKKIQIPRRANGTFTPGTSGNPKGRPKKDRRIPHPETVRDMHYDVAEFGMTANINGKPHKMNLMQANLLTLGMAGAAGDKASARAFVGAIQLCTQQEQHVMESITKRLAGITPAYTRETDLDQRAILKEAWERTVAEATGERQKTTGGLGKKRPRRWPEQ